MGLYHKHHTPADEGFEAARHENSEEARLARKKKLDEALAEKLRLTEERKKQRVPEVEKTDYSKHIDKQLKELFAAVAGTQEKLNELVESDKKVHEEISSEGQAVYEFVESVETEQTGGGVMLDYIMFKHTDIVIIIGINSIGLYESFQDFQKGKDPIEFLEIEEMEKVMLKKN